MKKNIPDTRYKIQNTKGFTLIELLLSLSITAVILLVISLFLATILQSRVKHEAISEVEEQGRAALQMVAQTVRIGTGINIPSAGTSGSFLSVGTTTASANPTTFGVAAGVLQIKEGTTASTTLTNSRIVVSNFTIENLSRAGTPGTIRIQFTAAAANVSGRGEYSYQKTFSGAASLR